MKVQEENQVNYVDTLSIQHYFGMIHVIKRNKKYSNNPPSQYTSQYNPPHQKHNNQRGSFPTQGPSYPLALILRNHVVTIKTNITYQLKSSPTKMSIYDLLQTSKAHGDALMDVLKKLSFKHKMLKIAPTLWTMFNHVI